MPNESRQHLRGQIEQALVIADELGIADVGIALDKARVALLLPSELAAEQYLLDAASGTA